MAKKLLLKSHSPLQPNPEALDYHELPTKEETYKTNQSTAYSSLITYHQFKCNCLEKNIIHKLSYY